MIRLKDLKNEFKVIKSITVENAYNLYSNTRHGNRSVFLYLGYVTVKNGKVTHYPTGTITSDIKELHEIVNTWADNAEYDVITYSPDGNFTTKNENYYQDKYQSHYDKEQVEMQEMTNAPLEVEE